MKKAKNHKKTWTIEEDDYLERKWGRASVKSIAGRLNRSMRSVEHRALELELGGMYKTGEFWMASDVARVLGIYRSTVGGWINKYGLKANKVCYKDQPRYQISLEDLLEWLEQNQSRWSAKGLEEYSLGCEPEWLIIKRKEDSKKKSKREAYTDEEDSIIVSMYKLDYTFDKIAKETGRTVDMVKNRVKVLRESGKYKIPYKNGRTQTLNKAV